MLLLSNGRVLTGPISEDESNYIIKQGSNDLRFPKREVQGAFPSLEEAYRYKLARVPDRDPDEQLKLARWCMSMKLMDEARTALEAVIALSPNHAEARSMLEFSRGAEARAARRDPEVQQSAAEVAEDEEPMHLNPAVIRKGIRELGVSGQPVIFDLPAALAVKRTNEFVSYVHPVLQRACARCHNEQYPGSFQLVQVKTRHDQTAEVFRANLDATLRLVDPENLAKSESSPAPWCRTARVGTSDRSSVARMTRSTDPLVLGEQPPTPPLRRRGDADGRRDAEAPLGRGLRDEPGESRGPRRHPQPYPAPVPQAPPVFEEAIPTPPGQMIPESATGAQPYAPADVDFQSRSRPCKVAPSSSRTPRAIPMPPGHQSPRPRGLPPSRASRCRPSPARPRRPPRPGRRGRR